MGSWIDYANQGAVRSQPLSPDLVQALSYLEGMGVTAKVFSGGQDAEGPNRVGSTRHNHGDAADVFFYQNGRRLDWSNPSDLPIFEEIVRQGRANGLTGFGAGDGYMQPGSMHVGFGNEAVWGAGGSSANAPEWLQNAYNGAPQGQHFEGDGHNHGTNALSGFQSAQQGPMQQDAMAQMTPEQIDRAQKLQLLQAIPRMEANALNVADFQRKPQNALATYGFGQGQNPFV